MTEPKCTDNHAVLIRRARVDAGMSLREGAALLGLTPVQLGELERGVRDVPHDEWDRMFAEIERVRSGDQERTGRGFRVFGDVTDSGGEKWTVIESSLAGEGAHCRLYSDGPCMDFPGNNTGWHKHDKPREQHMPPAAHLSVEQAERLASALMQFVREARANRLTEPAARPRR